MSMVTKPRPRDDEFALEERHSNGAPPQHYGDDRTPVLWRYKWVLLAAALTGAALAYGVSKAIPPTYQSSVLVRVSAQPSEAPQSEVVQASNDLASQYAQLADSGPVLDAAARRGRLKRAELDGNVTGGTVADQNLIRIEAQGGSPETAARRANAVAGAFAGYLERANADQARRFRGTLNRRLAPLSAEIRSARRDVEAAGGPGDKDAASAEATVADLLRQRQEVLSRAVGNSAQFQPRIERLATATNGTQVQPKPVLYAIAAFVVFGLVAAQVVSVARGRRS